jgi:hypothetical protein
MNVSRGRCVPHAQTKKESDRRQTQRSPPK